jgi:hypothetical protein
MFDVYTLWSRVELPLSLCVYCVIRLMVIRIMSKPAAVLKQPPYAKLDFSLQSVVYEKTYIRLCFCFSLCVAVFVSVLRKPEGYIYIATFYETSTKNFDIIYPVNLIQFYCSFVSPKVRLWCMSPFTRNALAIIQVEYWRHILFNTCFKTTYYIYINSSLTNKCTFLLNLEKFKFTWKYT